MHIGKWHFTPVNRLIGFDSFVHQAFDVSQLRVGKFFRMIEVKPESIRRDERAALPGVRAHDFMQCPVKKVRGRVMPLNVGAPLRVHGDTHRLANFRRATIPQFRPVDK